VSDGFPILIMPPFSQRDLSISAFYLACSEKSFRLRGRVASHIVRVGYGATKNIVERYEPSGVVW